MGPRLAGVRRAILLLALDGRALSKRCFSFFQFADRLQEPETNFDFAIKRGECDVHPLGMRVPDGGAQQVPDKNHARGRRTAVQISNPGEGWTFVGARQTIAPLVQSFRRQSLKADGQDLSLGPEKFEFVAFGDDALGQTPGQCVKQA